LDQKEKIVLDRRRIFGGRDEKDSHFPKRKAIKERFCGETLEPLAVSHEKFSS
jgi:hypothetical protein